MVTITHLTPAAAQQALQDDGAASLGLTAPLLSPVWSNANPTFDPLTLTLNFANTIQIPFLGIFETIDTPRDLYGVDGTPINGPVTRIRFHPQAGARLETLAAGRYAGPGMPFIHPVATQMAIRSAGDSLAPQWWEPGDTTALSGTALSGQVSFHDTRGLIVCPVAVAAMYADLVTAFPALLTLSGDAPDPGATIAGAGGLNPIATLATGVRVHIVTPHGGLFAAAVAGRTLTRRDGAAVTATLDAGGLMDLPAGQTIRASDADDGAAGDDQDFVGPRLRWGWSNGGTLARTPLSTPDLPSGGAPPAALPRQFLRLTVVDLPWHLLGNRTTTLHDGIPGDDGDIPAFYQPRMRPDLPIDYLADGVAVIAGGGQVIQRLIGTGSGMVLTTSPVLDAGVAVPPAADATGRWPAFPVPNTGNRFRRAATISRQRHDRYLDLGRRRGRRAGRWRGTRRCPRSALSATIYGD